jgi:hypothetical protein
VTPEAEALICAQASDAIYGTPADPAGAVSSQATMAALGFTNFQWIDLTTVFKDVCAFIVSSDEFHLLVFRGTKLPQDWMTDLYCTPVRFEWIFTGGPTIGEIHSGFGHCLADKFGEITQKLSGRDSTLPLVITGHSLGGALAALAGACFTVLGSSVPGVSSIYTFGQPRIGLHDFCNTYSRIMSDKLVRFVNKQDLVPRVPFRGWDYSDEGTMIHFDSTGEPSIESSEWQSFLMRTLQSWEDVFNMITHFGGEVADHSMAGYHAVIAQKQDALSSLFKEELS